MICRECGTENESGVQYCKNCMADLNFGMDDRRDYSVNSTDYSYTPIESKSLDYKSIIVALVGGILVLFGYMLKGCKLVATVSFLGMSESEAETISFWDMIYDDYDAFLNNTFAMSWFLGFGIWIGIALSIILIILKFRYAIIAPVITLILTIASYINMYMFFEHEGNEVFDNALSQIKTMFAYMYGPINGLSVDVSFSYIIGAFVVIIGLIVLIAASIMSSENNR